MSDLISRSDAIGAVKEERFPIDSDYAEGFMAALDKVEWILKEWLPSAQPDLSRGRAEAHDEIVRCKDCGKASKCYGDVLMKARGGGYIYCPLEFCSEAERRTDG